MGYSLAESRRRIVLNSQNNITATGYAYYKGNLSLTFIDLPGGVKAISNNTFQSCSNLVKVIMPDGVTSIGPAAFDACSKLKSINSTDEVINIPNGVKNIEFAVFRNCSGMKAVRLPSGVTSIANQSFQGCTHLVSITCMAVVPPSITVNSFTNVPSTANIYVPAESVEAYKAASYWSSRANYIQAIPA